MVVIAAPMPVIGVVAQEEPRAPHPLELDAEHPDAQHVEQDVRGAGVQEHVRDQLPEPAALDDVCGSEPE